MKFNDKSLPAQTMRKNTEYFDPSLTLRRFMMVNLYRMVGLVF